MEDIIIPMSRGNMEDIEQDGNVTENMNSESMMTEGDSISTQANSQTIYEREERFVLCLNVDSCFCFFLVLIL